MEKSTRALIWSAIILRIIISSVFYHPDIKSQHFHASLLSTGVANIYSYITQNKSHLPYTDTFNYPPLTYYFLGSWQIFIGPLVGSGLHSWLWDWSEYSLQNSQVFSYLLLLKLPYLIADLTLLLIGRKFLNPESKSKSKFTWLWAFNPISLYCIYMIGQFDILPSLLSLLAVYLFQNKKYLLTGLLIGIGMSLKTYPILFLPIFLLITRFSKSSVYTILGAIVGWAVPNIWFLSSIDYQHSVLQSSLASRLFALQFLHIPLFPVCSLIIYYSCLRLKSQSLLFGLFSISLLSVLFTDFHAQWLLWSLPFALLLAAKNKYFLILSSILYLLALIFIFLIPDQYVLVGLFTPQNPLLSTIPPLSNYFSFASQIQQYLHYILIALGIYLCLRTYYHEKSI